MINLTDGVQCGVNVRVWHHDLRGRYRGGLPAAWVRELGARGHALGATHLVDAGHNLVTATGLTMIAARMQGVSFVGPLSHMAVGTGTAAPTADDAALETEVARDVFTQVTTAPALLVLRNYLGPNAANGHLLSEAGLFNAAAGPSLYARRLFDTPLLKTPDSAATLEWTIAFAAGDEAFAAILRRAQRHLLT